MTHATLIAAWRAQAAEPITTKNPSDYRAAKVKQTTLIRCADQLEQADAQQAQATDTAAPRANARRNPTRRAVAEVRADAEAQDRRVADEAQPQDQGPGSMDVPDLRDAD